MSFASIANSIDCIWKKKQEWYFVSYPLLDGLNARRCDSGDFGLSKRITIYFTKWVQVHVAVANSMTKPWNTGAQNRDEKLLTKGCAVAWHHAYHAIYHHFWMILSWLQPVRRTLINWLSHISIARLWSIDFNRFCCYILIRPH